MLETLLPGDVESAWGNPDDPTEALFPEEEQLVAGAIVKRQREFAKGRECARRALAALGVPPGAILAGARREPLWPAEVVGSITHTAGFCAAAVARADAYAGLGIDAEPDAPLAPHLAERVCSREERARLERARFAEPPVLARLVFCVKEAVYKLQYPLTRAELGFAAVSVEVSADGTVAAEFLKAAGRFGLGAVLRGRWRREGGFLLAALWLPAGAGRSRSE